MPSVPETIRRLRERVGLTPQELATRIWMNVPSYFDLETCDSEWEQAAELSQLLEFSRIVSVPLLTILGEDIVSVRQPISFGEMSRLIRERVQDRKVEEAKIAWDLSEFFEAPMIAMEYPILFLKIVAQGVGFDWRQPILYYQEQAERGCS